jgi:hypothetical protein
MNAFHLRSCASHRMNAFHLRSCEKKLSFFGTKQQTTVDSSLTNFMVQLLEKSDIHTAYQIIPRFCGMVRFTTVFTKTHHQTLSWSSSTQSPTSHITSVKYILIFYCRLFLRLTQYSIFCHVKKFVAWHYFSKKICEWTWRKEKIIFSYSHAICGLEESSRSNGGSC